MNLEDRAKEFVARKYGKPVESIADDAIDWLVEFADEALKARDVAMIEAIRLIASCDAPNECINALGVLMRALPLDKQPDLEV